MDLKSLFPVYLPKTRTDDQSREEYDTQIAQNENVINQNFKALLDALQEVADLQDSMGSGSTETVVQTVVSPGPGSSADFVLSPATETTLGGIRVGKNLSITPDGVLSVATTDVVAGDNTNPITSAAVHTQIGNINALLETI